MIGKGYSDESTPIGSTVEMTPKSQLGGGTRPKDKKVQNSRPLQGIFMCVFHVTSLQFFPRQIRKLCFCLGKVRDVLCFKNLILGYGMFVQY